MIVKHKMYCIMRIIIGFYRILFTLWKQYGGHTESGNLLISLFFSVKYCNLLNTEQFLMLLNLLIFIILKANSCTSLDFYM